MTDLEIPRGELPEPLGGPIDDFRYALFRRTPHAFITPLLLALNVVVFVAMIASGVSVMTPTSDNLLRWGADFGPYTTNGQQWRLLTNTFVHVGVIHLGMNMLGLWQIGRLVERLLGNVGFAVTYVLAGLGGSLLSTVWHPLTVSAGASGAIFGIYGALIAYLLRHRGSIPTTVLQSLQKSAVTFVALNIVIGLKAKGIDMAAHAGGFLGGMVIGAFVARPLAEAAGRATTQAIRVALVGVTAVIGLAFFLPKSADLSAEIAAFQKVEHQAIVAYNAAIKKAAAGELPDDDFAAIIERDVLPPWRTFQRHLAAVKNVPAEQKSVAAELSAYLAARERAWTKTAEALRRHDQVAAQAANQELQDAARKLKLLSGGDDESASPDKDVPVGPPSP